MLLLFLTVAAVLLALCIATDRANRPIERHRNVYRRRHPQGLHQRHRRPGLVPGSKLKVFKGASHEHHLEETGAYLAAVREFMRRVDAAD